MTLELRDYILSIYFFLFTASREFIYSTNAYVDKLYTSA